MIDSRWSRRRFLGTLGLGASMLPFFPLLDAHADAGPGPRRLLLFFSANGTIRESWLPTMADSELVLSPILAPLEKHKSKLLVVDGLNQSVVMEKGEHTGHSAGMNTALTGCKAKMIDSGDPNRTMATGISIDQHLAQRIGTETKLRSLELGVQVPLFTSDNAALSYAGPLRPILPENSPYVSFDRIFRGFAKTNPAEEAAAKLRLTDRKSVLDAVARDLTKTRARLSQADRIKMEAHLGAIDAIEHSLTTGVGAGAARTCSAPDLGTPLDLWTNDNIPAQSRLQIDLMVMALACDLTRIGTIQYGRAGSQYRFNWLGAEFAKDPALAATDQAKGFHALAHKDADPASRAKLVKIHTWFAGELAYLLDKLQSIPERGGSMLDNTLVVWFNELGTGGTHSHAQTPWVLAGNVGGLLKTGRLATFAGHPHNRMLMTLSHAMGVEDPTFGDPDYCKDGPLTGLTT